MSIAAKRLQQILTLVIPPRITGDQVGPRNYTGRHREPTPAAPAEPVEIPAQSQAA